MDIEIHRRRPVFAGFQVSICPSRSLLQNFSGLSSVTKVVVIGHSLSEVGSAYFLALVEARQGQPSWLVAVRPEDDEAGKMQNLLSFGVPLEHISCRLWSEL